MVSEAKESIDIQNVTDSTPKYGEFAYQSGCAVVPRYGGFGKQSGCAVVPRHSGFGYQSAYTLVEKKQGAERQGFNHFRQPARNRHFQSPHTKVHPKRNESNDKQRRSFGNPSRSFQSIETLSDCRQCNIYKKKKEKSGQTDPRKM